MKNTGVAYAVIARGSLPTHFAFRMSFLVSSLEDGFIFHQAVDPVFFNHLRLSLQTGGWTLGSVSGANVVLGDRGAAGDWHTITYRVEGAPDAGSQVSVRFDQTETSLDLGADSGVFATAQLGAFWPLLSDPAQLVVDYDNVTAWDCTK